MTNRTEEHNLLMAYKSGDEFKIGTLSRARFTITHMGEIVGFELLHETPNSMKLVTLEHGESYSWHTSPDNVFIPLKFKVEDGLIEWRTADGQSGEQSWGWDVSETQFDEEMQDDFEECYAALQLNFSYLRERAIRKQPVVIFPQGQPGNADVEVNDGFFDEPFDADNY